MLTIAKFLLILVLVSPPTDSTASTLANTDEFKEEFNSLLHSALMLLQDRKIEEAYSKSLQLIALCNTYKNSSSPCDNKKTNKIINDFYYEKLFSEAYYLALKNDDDSLRRAIYILEEATPSCVLMTPSACGNEHNLLLNTTKIKLSRNIVNELVDNNDFNAAIIEQEKARDIYLSLPIENHVNYSWELAQLYSFVDPKKAVEEVVALVRSGRFPNYGNSIAHHYHYLGWLSKTQDTEYFVDELRNFFSRINRENEYLTVISDYQSEQDFLDSLSTLLITASNSNTDKESFLDALTYIEKKSQGKLKSLIQRFTGDYALVELNRIRLAKHFYRKLGLSEAEIDTLVSRRQTFYETLSDKEKPHTSKLDHLTRTAIKETLDGRTAAAKKTLKELYTIWNKTKNEDIGDLVGDYLLATDLLIEVSKDTKVKREISDQAHSLTYDIFLLHQEKYSGKDYTVDSKSIVDLLEYNLLLTSYWKRSVFHGDYESALLLANERLHILESIHGFKSHHLLDALSTIAFTLEKTGQREKFSYVFKKAKKIEMDRLMNLGICPEAAHSFKFPYDFARISIDQSTLAIQFQKMANTHLQKARSFIGIEKVYACTQSAKQLLFEHMSLADSNNIDVELAFKLAQISDISDLVISAETGSTASSIKDSHIRKLVSEYSLASHNINSQNSNNSGYSDRYFIYQRLKTELFESITNLDPALLETLTATPASIAQVKQTLSPGEALLYYIERDSLSSNVNQPTLEPNTAFFVFIVTKDYKTLIALEELPRSELHAVTASLRKSLDQNVTRYSQLQPFDLDSANSISDVIFKKIEPVLERKRINKLLIVPSTSLKNIPFEILPRNKPDIVIESFTHFGRYGQVGWLNDAYAISYLSSPRLMRSRNKRQNPINEKFLGVGNPHLSDRSAKLESEQPVTTNGRLEEILAKDFKTLNTTGASFAEIPETSAIIDALASNFGNAVSILKRSRASESELSRLDLGSYSTIAFATHGVLDSSITSEPALVLSKEPKDSVYDGILSAREIVESRLNADIVVLAACNTATPERASGLISLSTSFITAGAATVVASHWAVESKSTSQLFENYATLKNNNSALSTPELFQRARVQLIKKSKNQLFSHPAFWGAFTVYGF